MLPLQWYFSQKRDNRAPANLSCKKHNCCCKGSGREEGKNTGLFACAGGGRYLPQYWMRLEIPVGTTLAELDLFLRHIWLECCSHLSAFNIRGESYCIEPDDDYYDKDMRASLARVVNIGEYFNLSGVRAVMIIRSGRYGILS